MPPKGGITARIERLELVYSDLDDRLDLVLRRLNDICPTDSRKILDAMQKMEKNTLSNVLRFEGNLGKIAANVRDLVLEESNACLELVKASTNDKISGMEGRIEGVDRKFKLLSQSTKKTMDELDILAEKVEQTFEEAFTRVCKMLDQAIDDRLLLKIPAMIIESPVPSSMLSTGTFSSPSRGRTERRFVDEQRSIVQRSRSASRESLRGIIHQAQEVASLRDIRE